jgi:Na+-transporting methylmalonyl-CoA/oxaloacetate decarboxylase gamma subunit
MWSILGEGAKFSLIAQSMVFLVLFLLALVIVAMKYIFYRPGKQPAAAAAVAARSAVAAEADSGSAGPPGPEEEIRVAAIAAALEMHRRGAEAPPIAGPEGPWAPREPHSRPETLQSKSRRWSHG